MNARGWLEDGVDLALVGAVAAWIGITGAFLASLTPTGGREAAVQNLPPPGGAAAGGLLRPAAEDAHGRWQVRAGYLADGNAEAGTSYALSEMHDPAKAERIVRAVA